MKKIIIIVLILILASLWFWFYKEIYDLNIIKFEVPKKIYIINGEEYEVKFEIQEKDNKKISLDYTIENESIATFENGKVKGISDGKTILTIKTLNGISKNIEINVTSLIDDLKINNEKSYLTCKEYTVEEANTLEDILEYRISESGYKTRSGVVAAVRFLLLEFKNNIKYFQETESKIDGLGNFLHKGLYLTEEKYEIISNNIENEAKMWGCPINDANNDNGLSSEGFITWAFYNTGYDVEEISNIGIKEELNSAILYSGKVKVGDLLKVENHFGIIIGIDNNKFYVGESYENGLRIRNFTSNELINSEFESIILMTDFYKNDGNLTNMW